MSATSGDAEAPLVLRYLGGAGDGRRAHHRRLEAESASIVYSAQNFGESVGGGPPGYRYAVGVVSRKRDSVRLYEADGGGVVFGLQADASRGLTLLLGEAGAALARESTELGGMDSRAKRDALVDTFGSQKKKKMESARKANIVDVNAVAAAQEVSGGAAANASAAAAEAAAGLAETSGGAGAAEASNRGLLLPPFNLAAAQLTECYPLDTLLTPEVIALLRPLAKSILKADKGSQAEEGGGGREEGGGGGGSSSSSAAPAAAVEALLPASFNSCAHSRAVLLRLLALVASSQVEFAEASKRLQCLLYAAHLISLFHCGRTLKPRDDGAPFHASLGGQMDLAALSLHRFYEARSKKSNLPVDTGGALSGKFVFCRTDLCEKRMLYHIAALALRAEDFSLQLGPLAADMRISPVVLSKTFRELGCSCTKEKVGGGEGGGAFLAVLKLPFQFPLAPKGKR